MSLWLLTKLNAKSDGLTAVVNVLFGGLYKGFPLMSFIYIVNGLVSLVVNGFNISVI